ncbi:glycerophosphodiester phosphodiesterase [Streptomyces sp. SID8374]|uniref:glycerophosphodiester phosphodiesterase n=1 Tax=Streptomyces sp. SID8374 TaxID=2690354 RepID=UPI00136A480E|nr:glycerophosphodiester phosphodiesterase [Streptomyces sp. SID8374]MYX14366.1 glycerophosphodiester phosphodiesterase [Streptomyces sp. SID8374]
MPFPEGVPSVAVRYTITSPAGGGPGEGTLQLMPTVPAVRIPGVDGVFTGGGTYRFVNGELVDGEGEQVRLLPTSIDGANPAVWAWLGIESVNGSQPRHFYFVLDADAEEVDLGAIQQLAPDLTQYLAVPGESAYDAWKRAGNDGDEADFLASLIGPPGDIAAANEYTDETVTQALADEVTRADTAYEPAGAAATAQAEAVTAAVSTAAADAASKAAAAQSAAITAASSDATSKATAARDTAIATAATDATTKAGSAQTAAVSAAASAAAALYLPKAILTVDQFMAQPGTKIFGHRGAGMVAPEHSEAAYDYAVAHGIQAMELSVNVDSEGQLWCLHDLTLDRTTSSTGALNTYPSTGIANKILTNSKPLLGPGWTEQPLVPLRKMLDKYLGKGVILFLEPKGNDAVVPLQTLLASSYPQANQSVIWKAHVGTSFTWPKNNGFRTWCYVDDGSANSVLDAKDSQVDYWGVSTTMPSARRKEIVQRPGGKPVFSWPVYRRSQRTALEADGVVGMMSSDPVYVRGTTASATASRWDQQVKESGGTPWTDYSEGDALKFHDGGWVSINKPKGTYGLGRYTINPAVTSYRIQIEMKYDQLNTADMAVHGGLYLGKASDDRYEFNTINPSPGYHLILRHNGVLRLYRHVITQTGGILLGAADIGTDAPVAGQSMTIQVDVTPTTIEARRLGNPLWTTGPIADTAYRGGHFGLSNGSITDLASRPFWRNLAITPL